MVKHTKPFKVHHQQPPIDLVRYMNRLGGPSAVATVLTELAEQIETEEFAKQ